MKINHLSNEDIQKKIDELVAKYPVIESIDPSEYCCSGCAGHSMMDEHGLEVVDAWFELQDLYYLLG